jgi:hypothetical protein
VFAFVSKVTEEEIVRAKMQEYLKKVEMCTRRASVDDACARATPALSAKHFAAPLFTLATAPKHAPYLFLTTSPGAYSLIQSKSHTLKSQTRIKPDNRPK